MAQSWTPQSWQDKPARQMPDYPDKAALDRGSGPAEDPSAAGVRRRGAQPDGRRWPGGGRQGFPAAGRRLRRKLRRIPSRQYPRHLPRAAADGGRADLCRRRAGGEGRPHRRPVRQAAFRRFRDAGRRHAAVLSRRQHQWQRVHAGGAHSRSAAPAAGHGPVGGDAQPAARLRAGRLCRPAQCASLDAGLHRGLAGRRTLQRSRTAHFRNARLHGGLRHHAGIRAAAARHRFLHQPRGAAAGVRAGDDARRFHQRRLVRHQRPHAVDRRPHAPARRRPCRVHARHQESDRPEMRAVAGSGRSAAADRHPQSGEHARAG